MTGTVRIWMRPGLLGALLLCAVTAAGAQTATLAAGNEAGGSLAGRLTDLRSAPLDGATVVVRNDATGAETRGITRKNGSFRFTGLEPGAYSVVALSPQLGRGRLDGVVVSAGHEARVQAAMAFESLPAVVAAAARETPETVEAVSTTPAAGMPVMVAVPVPTFAVAATVAEGSPAEPGPREGLARLLRVSETGAEMPRTERAVVSSDLAEEPERALLLNGLPSVAVGREEIAAAPSAVAETGLAGPALRGPELAAMRLPEVEPRSTAVAVASAATPAMPAEVLALNEVAAAAARAAIEVVKPGLRPVLRAAEAAAVKADPAKVATTSTMTGAEVEALPAAGRRWQEFVLDTPAASTAAGGTAAVGLRGAGSEPAETSLDGVGTRMAFGSNGSAGLGAQGSGSNGQGGREQNGMGQAWAGGHGAPVAEAAIREVQTAAGNAEAEGDRTAGGRVDVETARGMNGLHGQGFVFDRQNTWGAQNPFTQWVKQTAPATTGTTPVFTAESYTPPDHETVWGFGVGSQIRRDKLFWFGAVDTYRRNDAGLATVKHPEEFFAQPSNDQLLVLCARLGLTMPGPPGTASSCPFAQVIADYSQMLTTLDGLLGPAPRRAEQGVGFGRVDWNATERQRFTLEGTGARWNSPGGGLTRVSETYGANSFGSSQASEALLLGRWEAFLTPNLLAVTQGSAGRNILSAHAETPSAFEQTFLGPNAYGQLPQIVVDNRYGFTIGNPSRFGAGSYPDERVYQGQETVNWVHGNLLVKAGGEFSHNADATSLLRNETGTYSYASVENFASDALVFAQDGLQNPSNVGVQHGCDERGTVWRDSDGNPEGRGNLPCYAYYSQMIGPTNWSLSTNDYAGFVTAQWQPRKLLVMSGGLRWEREQLPPPIAAMVNQELPLTGKLPSLGNDWGPRISLALGSAESHWPVLRVGYGMYFGRTENATVETALTQTGSADGDQYFFVRPADDCQACTGGAPAFPYVLRPPGPGSMVRQGAAEFAGNFRNLEVHQAVAAVEEELPGHVQVTASALASLARRLPVFIDMNLGPAADAGTITYQVCDSMVATSTSGQCGFTGAGPIKSAQITVPFYASVPSSAFLGWLNNDYQQIDQMTSEANSTYEAAVLKVERYGRRGLSLHAHYTYAHAMDWNPGESPLEPSPAGFSREEYGASDLDMRHSAAGMVIYEAPWKLHNTAGRLGNGWMISAIAQFHSGLPYTMRTSGSLPECVVSAGITPCTLPNAVPGTNAGDLLLGLRSGMNGSGGDNRVYGVGSDGHVYNIGRNTYRYPATWKADMRVGKKFDLGRMRELELLVESFNLFNHQNVTELETTGYYLESGTSEGSLPTLNFLTGLKPNTTAFGQPLNVNATNFYRERQIQAGIRMRF